MGLKAGHCVRVPVRIVILQERSGGEMGPQRKMGSQELRSSQEGRPWAAQHPRAWAPLPFALSWCDCSGKPSTKGGLPLGLRGVAAWGGSGLGVFSLQIVANRFHRALHPLLPLSLPKAASL